MYRKFCNRRLKLCVIEPEDTMLDPSKLMLYNICKRNISNSKSPVEKSLITKTMNNISKNLHTVFIA